MKKEKWKDGCSKFVEVGDDAINNNFGQAFRYQSDATKV